MSDLVETLLGARDKLLFGGWHQGSLAQDANGNCHVADPEDDGFRKYLEPWDPRAVSWCLRGAIEAVQGFSFGPVVHFVRESVRQREHSGYIGFNDRAGRTKEEVISMLDEIIADAKAQLP